MTIKWMSTNLLLISRCSGKDYVKAFNFRVQITKDMKSVEKFKETTTCLFFHFLLGLIYLVLLLPNANTRSRGWEELPRLMNNLTFEATNNIYTVVSVWMNF